MVALGQTNTFFRSYIHIKSQLLNKSCGNECPINIISLWEWTWRNFIILCKAGLNCVCCLQFIITCTSNKMVKMLECMYCGNYVLAELLGQHAHSQCGIKCKPMKTYLLKPTSFLVVALHSCIHNCSGQVVLLAL